MENKIITMSSRQFGTIRKIYDNGKAIYCGADVAKALGYVNPNKAINDHCRAITKRSTPISGKIQEINYIPEGDVYRLICHSKLPSAIEFEKWVFEDTVPKAVRKELSDNPKQLTLETSEYHYFDKTYKGQPVLSVKDIEHFTGLSTSMINWYLRRDDFIPDEDYYRLERFTLREFKAENPNIRKTQGSPFHVVTKSGFIKLMEICGCRLEMPKCFEKPSLLMIEEKKPLPSVIMPSESMKGLMGYIQNEVKAIEGISYLLLTPDTADNLKNYRNTLIRHLSDLTAFCGDVKLIKIGK